MRPFRRPALILAAATLAACGGSSGGGDETDDAPQATDTAAAGMQAAPAPAPAAVASNGPPQPFVDRGVCPFECCVYGGWTARDTIPVYAAERDTTRVAFRIARGESFTGATGNVHVDSVGIVAVRDTVTVGQGTGSPRRLAPGDTLYLLSPLGEGHFNAWHDGRTYPTEPFWEPYAAPGGTPRGELLRRPSWDWWAEVRSGGRTGWVHMSRLGGKVGKVDACGGE